MFWRARRRSTLTIVGGGRVPFGPGVRRRPFLASDGMTTNPQYGTGARVLLSPAALGTPLLAFQVRGPLPAGSHEGAVLTPEPSRAPGQYGGTGQHRHEAVAERDPGRDRAHRCDAADDRGQERAGSRARPARPLPRRERGYRGGRAPPRAGERQGRGAHRGEEQRELCPKNTCADQSLHERDDTERLNGPDTAESHPWAGPPQRGAPLAGPPQRG